MTIQEKFWPPSDKKHIHTLLCSEWYRMLAQIMSGVLDASHAFFKNEGLEPYMFPITTGSVSSPMGKGSDSLPVKVNIRGNEVYLADSMQFSLEIGVRLAKSGAYYIMPTFRGEPLGVRHLNEFFHSEAEIAGSLEDIMGLVERYILALAKHLYKQMPEALKKVAGSTNHIEALINQQERFFRRIRYSDAVEELEEQSGMLIKRDDTDYPNITHAGEQFLIKKYGAFTWLTHLPWENVPFYQARENGTSYSLSADLLAGIGEIAGCGQRIYSCKDLEESLRVHQVNKKEYEWYYDMREIHPLQTAGFGLGIERFILWLTRKTDIRECMLLIRDHDKVYTP